MTEDEERYRRLMLRAQRYISHLPGCPAGKERPGSPRCHCGAKEIYRSIQRERLRPHVTGGDPELRIVR